VGRCIGDFYVEFVSRLFDRFTELIFNYSACYKRLFQKKKTTSEIELSSGDDDDFAKPIELSSGDEDDVMEVKPKIEKMEPCCSSSLND
jgi:hypothetical protein